MTSKVLAGAAALLALTGAAPAQERVSLPPSQREAGRDRDVDFSPERFRAHVAFLADDLLEGRETGTRGYRIAANYVATRFGALGLQPAADGSWFQEVPFIRFAMTGAPARLAVGDRFFAQGEGVSFRQQPENETAGLSAPAVFAGHGLDAPALGFDDYAGLDVRGKVVVVLNGLPDGLPSDIAAHLNSERRRIAARHGAIGLIFLRPERNGGPRGAGAAPRPGLTWVDPAGTPFSDAPGLRFVATADGPVAEALFEGAPKALAQVLKDAERDGRALRGFALKPPVRVQRESAVTNLSSPNVVAVLPGSDPALRDEYVLLMAHLDGLGVRESGEGDRIRNGAMDNATGVSTLIEVARAMVESGDRPKRSILFAAVTAEENGLLGAQYLANNPVVDGRLVGVVNLDMPILTYDFSDVIAFGAEHSTLGPIVERAAARMGVSLSPDPLPQQGLFTRSDHYMFVREGIPSVFLMTGFAGEGKDRFTDFLGNQYHSPKDDLSLPFNWQAGAKFARLNYLIAREIADAAQAPSWNSDSFFARTSTPAEVSPRASQR